MRNFAPDAQLAAITAQWGGFYTRTAAGRYWTAAGNRVPVWGGIKDGMVDLSAIDPKVDPAVRALVDAKRRAIVTGRFQPFTAPLVDNQGRVRLARGALDDAAIATMDWLAEGVVGTVPR